LFICQQLPWPPVIRGWLAILKNNMEEALGTIIKHFGTKSQEKIMKN
jgi:hypothetical protein